MRAEVVRFLNPLNNLENFLKRSIRFIKNNLDENEKVILALSGGVDSSVVTKLFERAIGDRLYPIHFDTGFMRTIQEKEEVKLVREKFKGVKNFEVIDKKKFFYEKIFGIEDAEEKRRKFRECYEKLLNEKIREINATVIAQGTIRPDIMETDAKIKSQNNVDTNFDVEKLVEPVAGLFKPEVRLLAKELGFSRNLYLRQPFLGPGLSARVVGKITKEKLETEKIANDLVERGIEKYFERNYGKKVLWDKNSGNRVPFQYFAGTFDRIVEENEKLNSYLKDLGTKAKAYTLKNKATGMREVNGKKERVYAPVVLLEGELEEELISYLGKVIPENFNFSRVLYKLGEKEGKWIVGIRGVRSKDALTAYPLQIPISYLRELGKEIVNKTETDIVGYDITPKPPATIEYE